MKTGSMIVGNIIVVLGLSAFAHAAVVVDVDGQARTTDGWQTWTVSENIIDGTWVNLFNSTTSRSVMEFAFADLPEAEELENAQQFLSLAVQVLIVYGETAGPVELWMYAGTGNLADVDPTAGMFQLPGTVPAQLGIHQVDIPLSDYAAVRATGASHLGIYGLLHTDNSYVSFVSKENAVQPRKPGIVTVVPEPATLSLLALGGLALLRRRPAA